MPEHTLQIYLKYSNPSTLCYTSKFERQFDHLLICVKQLDKWQKSAYPDLIPHSVASDLGLDSAKVKRRESNGQMVGRTCEGVCPKTQGKYEPL